MATLYWAEDLDRETSFIVYKISKYSDNITTPFTSVISLSTRQTASTIHFQDFIVRIASTVYSLWVVREDGLVVQWWERGTAQL